MIDWAQRPAHVAHAESSRDPKVRVELRGPLSYRARLSLSRTPRPRRAVPTDRQTLVPIHTARVRRTPRPEKKVVVS